VVGRGRTRPRARSAGQPAGNHAPNYNSLGFISLGTVRSTLTIVLSTRRLFRIQQTLGVSYKIRHFVRALHDYDVTLYSPDAVRGFSAKTGHKNDRIAVIALAAAA